MTVTHNGKQYTAKKLNDNEWQLTSVSAPREKLTLNRWQMHIAGLLKQVEVKVMINHHLLRAAQSKAAIAMFIGDGAMWMAAYDEMKVAIGYPWHRKTA